MVGWLYKSCSLPTPDLIHKLLFSTLKILIRTFWWPNFWKKILFRYFFILFLKVQEQCFRLEGKLKFFFVLFCLFHPFLTIRNSVTLCVINKVLFFPCRSHLDLYMSFINWLLHVVEVMKQVEITLLLHQTVEFWSNRREAHF